MKAVAFDVMLNGVRLTTIFKPYYMTAEKVRQHLIKNEWYDDAITVERLG
jgi:hypothetical protein